MSDEYEGQSEESYKDEATAFRGDVAHGRHPRRIRMDLCANMIKLSEDHRPSDRHLLVEIDLKDAILLKEELIHIIAQCRERGWRQDW